MLKELREFLDGIRTDTRKLVEELTRRHLNIERYDVTTAPNGTTIGVTQPFGSTELQIPYSFLCANAGVGDTVLVVWWNSLSTAQAWFMGNGWGSKVPPVTQDYSIGVVELYASSTGETATTAWAKLTAIYDAMPERSAKRVWVANNFGAFRGMTGGQKLVEIIKSNDNYGMMICYSYWTGDPIGICVNNAGTWTNFGVSTWTGFA